MKNWNILLSKYNNLVISEKLILVNILCFFIPFFINTLFFLFNIESENYISFVELSSDISSIFYKPWTLITYSFFHTRLSHLFWNMLILYYSSSIFLNLFKKDTFINVYFMGVIFGGLFFEISYLVFPVFQGSFPVMIGASAGVMSILIFVCTYSPNNEIRLLFFNIKLKYIGIALIAVDLVMIPYGNSGGRISHLGGAFLGYLYAKSISNGRDIGTKFQNIWKYFINFFSNSKLNIVHEKKSDNVDSKVDNYNQNEIDKILDKISKSGYDSLTNKEKETLFNAGK
ncbi:MAG: rhomboid family intramembrane serine protease [Flavobacteriaceae bacterium]|nr:rhomboid family intramembrane serine protease [Flavobacteriaceae bacterium]